MLPSPMRSRVQAGLVIHASERQVVGSSPLCSLCKVAYYRLLPPPVLMVKKHHPFAIPTAVLQTRHHPHLHPHPSPNFS